VQYSCQNCGKIFGKNEGIIQFAEDTPYKEQYFPNDAFETLYQSEEKNFWFRTRNEIIGNAIVKYQSLRLHVLEVGCGTGYVSRHLKKMGCHVDCADLFFDALQFCKSRNAGEQYYQYNVLDRIFVEEFDGVCAFDVLEHISDDTTVLKNLNAALKPKGLLFITVPAGKRLWSLMDTYAGHKRRYSAQELRTKIEGNGFKVIKLSYFMTFLFPVILLSRKLSLRTKDMNNEDMREHVEKTGISELQLNGLLNAAFFLVFSLEVPLLRLFSFPFGSSLLCVAIKEQ